MRLERLHITVFLGISAIVWFVVLLARGTPVTWDHAAPFSSVVGVLVSLGLLLERWGWRQPLLHGWFVRRPDLRGTWRVELQSSYVDPGTNERVPMILCYMGVKQTLSTLQMHLMTPESESWFIAERVITSGSGSYRVVGVYTNEPDVHLRNEHISEIHQGAIIIDTHWAHALPHDAHGEVLDRSQDDGHDGLHGTSLKRVHSLHRRRRALLPVAATAARGCGHRVSRAWPTERQGDRRVQRERCRWARRVRSPPSSSSCSCSA